MGLPARSYYLKKGAKAEKLRQVYVEHVSAMLGLAGGQPAKAGAAAADVLRIETALATAAKTPVQRRDPHGRYNRVNREGLIKLAPSLDWAAYFNRPRAAWARGHSP